MCHSRREEQTHEDEVDESCKEMKMIKIRPFRNPNFPTLTSIQYSTCNGNTFLGIIKANTVAGVQTPIIVKSLFPDK